MKLINIFWRLWGAVRNIAQHMSFYIQSLTLLFSTVTVYATTIAPYFREMNINIPFWAFAVAVVLILFFVGWFELKCTMPSFFNFWNYMWWHSNNPMKTEIELIEKRQKIIMEKMGLNDDDIIGT